MTLSEGIHLSEPQRPYLENGQEAVMTPCEKARTGRAWCRAGASLPPHLPLFQGHPCIATRRATSSWQCQRPLPPAAAAPHVSLCIGPLSILNCPHLFTHLPAKPDSLARGPYCFHRVWLEGGPRQIFSKCVRTNMVTTVSDAQIEGCGLAITGGEGHILEWGAEGLAAGMGYR